ncbi:MAG: hypothetical protein ACREQ5_13925, partial [Candidatus Dormibacteria bacterium]
MAGEMFGAPNGISAYQDMVHTQALTRLGNAEAATQETRLQQEQAAQQIMQKFAAERQAQHGIQTGEQQVAGMRELSNRLMQAGLYSPAMAITKEVAGIDEKVQQTRTSLATQKYRELQSQEKAVTDLHNLVSGINSPEDFQQAKMVWMSDHPNDPIPAEFKDYNPQLIHYLQQTTKTGLDRLKENRLQLDLDFRRTQLEHKDANEKADRDQRRETARMNREAADRRAKSIGKTPVVGMPSSTLISVAESLIAKDYPNLPKDVIVGKDMAASTAAFDIASDAKALLANNRGMSPSEAVTQAYGKKVLSGELQHITTSDTFAGHVIPFTSKKGSTYKTAPLGIPLPSSEKDMKVGQVYQTSQGPVRWTAKGGVLLSG